MENTLTSTTPLSDISRVVPHVVASEQQFCMILKRTLVLFGKLLTGPWMEMFYTSAESDISHVDGIDIIKKVIAVL